MFGYVYKVENTETGKFYIGQHKYKPEEPFMKYLGSSSHPDFRLKNYPRKVFVKEILEWAESPEELAKLETKWIEQFIDSESCVNKVVTPCGGELSNRGHYGTSNEYQDFCPICDKETYHYRGGKCKACVAKHTYETSQIIPEAFRSKYRKAYCEKCGYETTHKVNQFNEIKGCVKCYSKMSGYKLIKENGIVNLYSGGNLVLKDVSWALDIEKRDTENTVVYDLPVGTTTQDADKETEVKAILKNRHSFSWVEVKVIEIGKRWGHACYTLNVTEDHPFVTEECDFVKARDLKIGDKVEDDKGRVLSVKSIRTYTEDKPSYDIETESGFAHFGHIRTRQCRTRLFTDVNGDHSTSVKRGNASFTSINLPRLAIKANHDIDKFFNLLDDMLNLVHDQLYERYKWQCTACPEEFAYIVKNNTMIGADKWLETGNAEECIKHGSLSIGFIGLAETLIALIGKHHGESEEAQELGLRIIGRMRDFCDKKTQEEHLNWSLLGTPAEGLSGRFTAVDKERYGIIPGVTDKDYYTNSSHVPVYYPISAFKKIDIEAPYHALENAGHIAYIELDGDASQNIEALESIVRHMKEKGVGYGAINHPVDKDPVCGYEGIIGATCPLCGRRENNIPFDKLTVSDKN